MNADHQQRNREHLRKCLRLSQFARADGVAFGGGDAAQTGNRKLPAHQKHHQPARHDPHLHQRNQRGRNQQLVRDGIQQRSDRRYLFPAAGEIAVQQIGRGGYPENIKRNDVICDDSSRSNGV